MIATDFAQQKLETVGAKQCGFCNHLLCPLWQKKRGKGWCLPARPLLLTAPRCTRQSEPPFRGHHSVGAYPKDNSFLLLLDCINHVWRGCATLGHFFSNLGPKARMATRECRRIIYPRSRQKLLVSLIKEFYTAFCTRNHHCLQNMAICLTHTLSSESAKSTFNYAEILNSHSHPVQQLLLFTGSKTSKTGSEM